MNTYSTDVGTNLAALDAALDALDDHGQRHLMNYLTGALANITSADEFAAILDRAQR